MALNRHLRRPDGGWRPPACPALHNRARMEKSPLLRSVQVADHIEAAARRLEHALQRGPCDAPETLEAVRLASAALYWLDTHASDISQDLLRLAQRYYRPIPGPSPEEAAALREQMNMLLEQVRGRGRWRRQVESLR